MAANGASIIRLDAFAYACKRAGGSCFFEQPDTSNLLDAMQEVLGDDIMVLPEIHEHYTMQFKVSEMGYWVYDFALPGLLQIVAYAPGDSISFTYTEKNGIYTYDRETKFDMERIRRIFSKDRETAKKNITK